MVSLPGSYLSLLMVTATGWFGATPQAALITGPVEKAAQTLVQRISFPAFIVQILSTDTSSASLLSFCMTENDVKTAQQVQLAETSAAGAQAATVAACVAAVLGPLVAWGVYASIPAGLPRDVRHRDRGVYNGEWSQGKKEGFGVYKYASGARYEGSWKANLKHGHGIYHYPGGGSFEGVFAAGQRSGVGVRLWPHGAAKAALFEKDKMVSRVELPEAAEVMHRANEAAAAARAVHTGGLSLPDAAKAAFLSAPVAAVLFVMATAAFKVPVPESTQHAISIAASVHLPLVLLLFGANMPSQLPEVRHTPSIRSVLAIRQISALVIGILLLISTPQTIEHAMRSAAVLCCLLAPISRQALTQAASFKLNRSLLNSTAVSSYAVSGVCMCFIAFTAWCKDIVPIFTSLTTAKASTFPLLDQCLLLLALLTAASVFVPRLLVKKVVKMTVTAEEFLKRTQRPRSDTPEPPTQSRSAAAGAAAAGAPARPLNFVKLLVHSPRGRGRVAVRMQHVPLRVRRTTKPCM